MNDPAAANDNEGRVLVLEPNKALLAKILAAIKKAAPAAAVDVARDIEGAQDLALTDRPNLFVLDIDATKDVAQNFLLDLRTSHPNARAIMLTGVHLPENREQTAGIGAIHFLEKPFAPPDFMELVQTLLRPAESTEKFQGTLSDLHLSDIIQLKCMSGATSALEFTGPAGEKARVYFDDGQVVHAITPERAGVPAFNEIVAWKGGNISEVADAETPPRSIEMDWQFLLMEAVRQVDESSARRARRQKTQPAQRKKILVVDDSPMLVMFVQEILREAHYDVATAETAKEGLKLARKNHPDLILLDYLLPDFRGDEVSRQLAEDESTSEIPVLYMSGFGTDLAAAQAKAANVLGIVNKPFTSDLLLKTVEEHLGVEGGEEPLAEEELAVSSEFTSMSAPQAAATSASLWNENSFAPQIPAAPPPETAPFFAGDTNFFSLTSALRTIGREKLSGVFRCSLASNEIELYAQDGKFLVATTRDPQVYCPDEPVGLANIDPERVTQARSDQAETGRPFFLTLTRESLILPDAAVQLVQHYGQRLFAQLWAAERVRFAFYQLDSPPEFAGEIPAVEDVDHWIMETLRFVQASDLAEKMNYDEHWIPAFTRDGYQRIQNLRLTVAEAQFASQFNGSRSVAQIARNLRLDLKTARLNLFRFVALEIVECWPQAAEEQEEKRGVFKRLIGRK